MISGGLDADCAEEEGDEGIEGLGVSGASEFCSEGRQEPSIRSERKRDSQSA